MSVMYLRIKKLYDEGQLDADGVWNAYKKKMITREEFVQITNKDPLEYEVNE